MITLDSIKKGKGTLKKKKRIGRGNSSGSGTYSGRGLKGQKSRSGVSRGKLKRLGMKQNLLKTPKVRGFKSLSDKNQVVSIKAINENFKDNEVVSPETLLAKKLISKKNQVVKILGKESLTVKGLKFENLKMSDGVKKTLEK
ncbi:MAG: 50S ribosomal protein L15 [Patescibacteria group bacterium]|nr:50S ribosomal protein L15 [Patescibacteria group bacterium]